VFVLFGWRLRFGVVRWVVVLFWVAVEFGVDVFAALFGLGFFELALVGRFGWLMWWCSCWGL
ncbi:hypothetical protein, partial [Pseudomonas syringae group genomosp. 7]|uniref:hypothetical protein n=1 Tax=Pseudomonas syringae group genomosp. 7 TaxID=251699 RepID=UPI003770176F